MDIVSTSSIENSQLDGWQNYPVGTRRCPVNIDDVIRYREELDKKTPDLFVDEESKSALELLEQATTGPRTLKRFMTYSHT